MARAGADFWSNGGPEAVHTTGGGAPVKRRWLAVALVLQLLSGGLPALAKFDHTHALLSRELKRYVDGPLVHYRLWKKDQQGLDRYLEQLAAIAPGEQERFTTDEKKALWINAYNAITIKLVLDNYPIQGDKPYYPRSSLRQIPNVWEDFRYKVAGTEVNLETIEHQMIRRQFQDPRMHFAVVCASKGCPALLGRAYVGQTMDRDLDQAARRYFASPTNIRYEPEKKEIYVSQLFRWFPLDFAPAAGFSKIPYPPPSDDAIVLRYVLTMAPPGMKNKFSEKDTRIVYMPFDWTLNDADAGHNGNSAKPGRNHEPLKRAAAVARTGVDSRP